MIVPITPTIVPITPTIVAIVIARSVVIGVSVAVVRIIAWSTYEDPKVHACFCRLRSEGR